MDNIIEFINRRFKNTNANWMNGNCYYFSVILVNRFNNLRIAYAPIEGHFVAVNIDTNKCYDYTGYAKVRKWFFFDALKVIDPVYYDRLTRDCIM